jgi:hypothetical protein
VDDRVELGVEPLGAVDCSLGELLGACLAVSDELGLCGGIQPGQVLCRHLFLS